MASKSSETSLVIKQGNSLIITIPDSFAKNNGLKKGDRFIRESFGDTIKLKVIHR